MTRCHFSYVHSKRQERPGTGLLKPYVLVTLLLLATLCLPAQQQISLRQEFSFSPYPDPQQRKVNEILQVLAEGSGKLRVFTSYTLVAELLAVPAMDDHGLPQMDVFVESVSVQGDTHYRDFSLSHILLPDQATIRLSLLARGDKVITAGFHLKGGFPAGGGYWFSVPLEQDPGGEPVYLEVSSTHFSYDLRTFERMQRWGEAVESYYLAVERLDGLDALLENLYPASPERIILDEFRLCEAERILGEISHAPFQNWLKLEEGDPEGLSASLERTRSEVGSLRQLFNHSLEHIDSLLYEAGMALAESSSFQDGRTLFESVINYNPFHIPSHLALAQYELTVAQHSDALERLSLVYSQMFPSAELEKRLQPTTDRLVDHFLSAADSLNAEGRHVQALAKLQELVSFCSLSAAYQDCSPFLQEKLGESHAGVYHSFLTVARRAMRDDRPDLAATYIRNAMDYQQEFSEFIRHDREARQLLYLLVDPAIRSMDK